LYTDLSSGPREEPDIQLEKTGSFQDESGDGYAQPGETISYQFTVTNTGNVTLTNVDITDSVGGVTISGGPIASMAPDAVDSTTFTGSYAVTQANIDAGNFYNLAEVCGTPPTGPDVCDDDPHDEPLPQNPDIQLEKTGSFQDESGDGYAQPGETISYQFIVTNTGNVTLTNVDITDSVGGVTIIGGPIASLAPGAVDSTTFTGSYAVTQADIDAGNFYNLAEVCGTPPTGPDVCDDDPHDEPLQPPPPPGGEDGCTPGFWKNNARKWNASAWCDEYDDVDDGEGYSRGSDGFPLFEDVFDITLPEPLRAKGKNTYTNPTLLDALNANGGGINALARHATAALLNACSDCVSYVTNDPQDIIDAVQFVLSIVDDEERANAIQMLHELLAFFNEAGCPHNQHGECPGVEMEI
jgi:uncharacterized repeat protein (TIGR01451 family)